MKLIIWSCRKCLYTGWPAGGMRNEGHLCRIIKMADPSLLSFCNRWWRSRPRCRVRAELVPCCSTGVRDRLLRTPLWSLKSAPHRVSCCGLTTSPSVNTARENGRGTTWDRKPSERESHPTSRAPSVTTHTPREWNLYYTHTTVWDLNLMYFLFFFCRLVLNYEDVLSYRTFKLMWVRHTHSNSLGKDTNLYKYTDILESLMRSLQAV